jgi:arylsulfatase A
MIHAFDRRGESMSRPKRYLASGTLGLISLGLVAFAQRAAEPASGSPPNFVFADDLGYGDLGSYGHPTIRTPRLDRMAIEGQRWTSFYAAASVCTPSRAGLLTGRLPVRSGMASDVRRVLFPDSALGLPQSELTIAELLKQRGYKTACIGKWHLGHRPEFLPTKNGFDSYSGIPYSNDMDALAESQRKENPAPGQPVWRTSDFNVPLMRDEKVVERPTDQTTLTRRYTEEAVRFVREHHDQPFFLYLAHNMPHIPLFASEAFLGKSPRGLYGDAVEEIDWGVGELLDTLRSLGLADRTLVVFTSDNGPWLIFKEHGGSAGLLKGGKGMTFEGGMREPAIFWWPGRIRPAVVTGIGSTLDLLPTLCSLAGVPLPADRTFDGVDLGPTLFEGHESPRQSMLFYRGVQLFAARKGPYKAHFFTEWAYGSEDRLEPHDPPLLYDLDRDPSESHDVAAEHPEVIAEIQALVDDHRARLVPGPDRLAERIETPQ